MISFERILTQDTELYDFMQQLIVDSFPPEEYRPLPELRQCTDEKAHFFNNIIFDNNTPIGLLTYWDFAKFCYIEHFAIHPDRRNGGHGQKALQRLCQLLRRPLVLEVEAPEEEMARRRIRFYQRQGFQLWEKPYLQPPYRPGDGYLPMFLMVHGDLECEKDFSRVRDLIYQEVYHAESPDSPQSSTFQTAY